MTPAKVQQAAAAFCFAGCDSLRSIVLPRTLKRIGGYCFAAPS